jgi:VIT1/CCC1 family predicted Fe2+/Mn2+ transporter
MSHRSDAARYRRNLQDEIDSAALYNAMAANEDNASIADIYRRLAGVEERHAEFWRKRLASIGQDADLRPSGRTRVLMWVAGRFGAASVLPAAATLEQVDRNGYDAQPEASATRMPNEERSHARLLSRLTRSRRVSWDGAVFARLEGRHRTGGGNALRAAVLGANDGLVSNLSLVMGVAGAASSHRAVVIAGVAGLIAGACSMAMGEWLSVQNAREMYEQQMATEADEIDEVPDEEREELVLIYRAKGLEEPQARTLAERIMADKKTALDTMAREELGVNPEDLGGSPVAAATASFAVFVVGALVPLLPFLFVDGTQALFASVAASALMLYATGTAAAFFTGQPAAYAGFRQIAFGLAAAGLTYAVGRLLGVAVTG